MPDRFFVTKIWTGIISQIKTGTFKTMIFGSRRNVYNRDLALLRNTRVAIPIILFENYGLSRGGAAR